MEVISKIYYFGQNRTMKILKEKGVHRAVQDVEVECAKEDGSAHAA